MSQRKNVFDSHSETEQIVWHRCPLMQVNLYHHQLTQQFVAHACTVWPHEQSTGAEHAFNRAEVAGEQKTFSKSACNSTQSLTVFEDLNCRGRGQGQGLENWSSRILEDKDFPQGQQHWLATVGHRDNTVLPAT